MGPPRVGCRGGLCPKGLLYGMWGEGGRSVPQKTPVWGGGLCPKGDPGWDVGGSVPYGTPMWDVGGGRAPKDPLVWGGGVSALWDPM